MADLPLFVLYGSATGNAESIAKDLASKYSSSTNNKNIPAPFTNVICCEANAFKKKCLPIWEKPPPIESQKYGVVVIISTTGNGDSPENASRFTRFIKRKPTIDLKPMSHVAFSVLGLGDTNYDKFCATGELVDKKLGECGGERVQKLVKADEATGLEDSVEGFIENVVALMAKACDKSQQESDTTDTGMSADADADAGPEEKKCDDVTVTTTVPEKAESNGQVKFNSNPNSASVRTESSETKNEIQSTNQNDLSTATTIKKDKEVPTSSNDNSSIQDIFSISGVSLVRKILTSLKTESGIQTAKIDDIDMIPKVDTPSLPNPYSSAFASCKFVVNDNDSNNKNAERCISNKNEILSSEIEKMTVSSECSDDDLHYTLNHPYESTILNARYLTKTPLDGARNASAVLNQKLEDSHSNECMLHNDEKIISAMEQFEKRFPLLNSSSGSSCCGCSTSLEGETVDVDDGDDQYVRNGKRVIEMTLDLPNDFTFGYEPGDSIGLLATNTATASQYVLSFLEERHNISASQLVSIDGSEAMTIDDVVHNYIDLCSPIKNKKLLVSLAQHATDSDEKDALNLLASTDPIGQELFRILVDDQYITVIDLLKMFPSCQQALSIDGLLAILPRIPPRYYSVCSSLLTTEEGKGKSLKVAFSVVDYMTKHLNIDGKPKRRIGGLVTTYLEAICSSFLGNNDGTKTTTTTTPKLRIFPKPSLDFQLPSDLTTPMILIGPGTGIAPFIGFLEHRQSQMLEELKRSTSENLNRECYGDIDLYFGCRYSDHDWLYEDKMKTLAANNVISKLNVAFSRENKTSKCYVQDKIKENAHHIAEMIIKNDAKVYICGDGNSMAKDVQSAIQNTLDEYYAMNDSGLDESTKQSIEKMKAGDRLLMDIWS